VLVERAAVKQQKLTEYRRVQSIGYGSDRGWKFATSAGCRRQLRAPENDNKSADGSLQGRVPHWMNDALNRNEKAIWAVG
jgi:hypothetical protein